MQRLLTTLFLLLLPFQALTQTGPAQLPDPLSDTVSDFADLLPPEVEARVADTLTKRRAATGVHVVLVTMDRIADYGGAGQRIEDYAKTLFNQWGIGDITRDDGILILVARSDREMRIALGAGYDVMWDNAAQRVIDRAFLPDFRNDNYPAGIESGVAATFDLIADPFAKGATPPPTPSSGWRDIAPFAIFGVLATGLIAFIARAKLGDALVRFKKCPTCGHRSLSRSRDVLTASTTTASGNGMMLTHCANCGWDRREPFTIPRVSSTSGSSGGFGGGSSSGGGASGRW